MSFNRAKTKILPVFLLILFMFSYCFLSGCSKKSDQPAQASSTTYKEHNHSVADKTISKSKSLSEIISARVGWSPILSSWYGKQMPDFEIKDIQGKTHRISDYKGKRIMIILWATWCQPCVQEVPHLIALRNIMAEDELAIIAISNETFGAVKAVAERKKMNYTVVSYNGVLPSPLNSIRGIPSAFFVNPDGTVKIVTEGSLYLGEMKAILLAE